jgi:hypothetical protein
VIARCGVDVRLLRAATRCSVRPYLTRWACVVKLDDKRACMTMPETKGKEGKGISFFSNAMARYLERSYRSHRQMGQGIDARASDTKGER